MKILLPLIITLFFISCKPSAKRKANQNIASIQDNVVQSPFLDRMNFTVSEQRLICGNKRYVNKTIPYQDKKSKAYKADILLHDGTDTVLVKTVNIDTFINAIKKVERYKDSVDFADYKQYHLVDIVPTSGIRNCNTFLIAKLLRANSEAIFIHFAVKAFGSGSSKKGRLWLRDISRNSNEYSKIRKALNHPKAAKLMFNKLK